MSDLTDIYRDPITGDPEGDHIFAVMKQSIKARFPNFRLSGWPGLDGFNLWTSTEKFSIRIQVTRVQTCSICGVEVGFWSSDGDWNDNLEGGICSKCERDAEWEVTKKRWAENRKRRWQEMDALFVEEVA